MYLYFSDPLVSAPANPLTLSHCRQRKVTKMMEKYAWSKFNKMETIMMMQQVMCAVNQSMIKKAIMLWESERAKMKLLKVKEQVKMIWRLNTYNPSCNVLIAGSARSNISYSG